MKAVIEAEDMYCCKVKACMVELHSKMTKGRLVRTVESENDVDPDEMEGTAAIYRRERPLVGLHHTVVALLETFEPRPGSTATGNVK
jgi:hypothetical protein